jgi:ribosomal protein S18 acetylase RimI-like enzyme
MTDLKIRPASNDDAEAIADVHLVARRNAMPWLPELHSREESIVYFRNEVIQRQAVIVAELDGTVVGFVALDGGHIDHLYVATGVQGRGIGEALLATAKTMRPAGLSLWTFQRNERARRFYEARGFAAARFTDGSRNEEREPDVLYVWSGRPGAEQR